MGNGVCHIVRRSMLKIQLFEEAVLHNDGLEPEERGNSRETITASW